MSELLSPARIAELWNPFAAWGLDPKKVRSEARRAWRENRCKHHCNPETPRQHGEIIANYWIYTHLGKSPLEFDCGVPGTSAVPYMFDGNHRLAASLLRGDKAIKVEVQGAVEIIKSLRIAKEEEQ